MYVEERQGNLFKSSHVLYGHGVNCRGIIGAGISAGFVNKWPGLRENYKDTCYQGKLQPGMVMFYITPDGKIIANLVTQNNPGKDAKLLWVVSSFVSTATYFHNLNLLNIPFEIAIPRIGCGIGGLKWPDVKQALEQCGWDSFKVIVYYQN